MHDAAGAVGGIAAQLAKLRGATVIGRREPDPGPAAQEVLPPDFGHPHHDDHHDDRGTR
ncbi:hypothetical protein [Cryobacterium sp. M25]|uniref:hypothetical protein n=1 Tax=Cryobacterium sp. M25 TaxID=2048293 RepID=UPI0018EC2A4B|nr:hypothetical protein [Cryobacterium sp. M25]